MWQFDFIPVNNNLTNDNFVNSLFMGSSLELMEAHDTMLTEIQSKVLIE